MRDAQARDHNAHWVPASIWWLALGYGSAYALFTFLTQFHNFRTVQDHSTLTGSLGLLSGAALALILLLPIAIAVLGRRAGPEHTSANPTEIALSGVAAAAIALSTITAFTLGGVSVVLALLLMRGGVLILAPLVDRLHHRNIRPAARLALGLSLLAVALPLVFKQQNHLSWVLVGTLAVYLGSYFIRLGIMNRTAKTLQQGLRAYYCAREFLFAWYTLAVAAFIIFLWQTLGLNVSLLDALRPHATAFMVGISYTLVLVAGTLVYLDPRENSFTIPLNRAASVAGGVLGASVAWLSGLTAIPSIADYFAAGIIFVALIALARDGWLRGA
ncbi:MAG: hypothetical protein AAGF57_19100 [Pseudomonadota bacterium]